MFKRAFSRVFSRNYSDQVLSHFQKPKNIGSLPKNDPMVGTALVGSPACFHEDTCILLDQNTKKTFKDLWILSDQGKKPFHVLSYNISTKQHEIQLARILHTGIKSMHEVILDDDTSIVCTPDHQFLTKDGYKPNKDLSNKIPLVSLHIVKKFQELFQSFDAYTLQVEQNNNYCLASNSSSGIVVKNCGDLIKFQIKVDENNNIIDAKTKVFGCASAISSTSYATTMIIGKSLDEASKITNKQIQQALSLAPVKFHCSMLAEDGIRQAIEDFKQKAKAKNNIVNVVAL